MQLLFLLTMMAITFCDALQVSTSVSVSTTTSLQAVVTPLPCERVTPEPCELQTQERFNRFAYAFIYEKNLTKAFEYIAVDYINHNPFAQNGSAAALDILGPVWGNTTILPFRTRFKDNMGWLNYNASGIGEVVDRFRWEGGCIVEHWDVGETYPPCGSPSDIS
ncbi:hypothetical protein FAUST_12107 [Fusarium austroamericanum]|uniref:SnoaL-like domain-containing protein n=1 Tax=Fusarium austroamericanum TaxID=282268 RepID=A0AAN6BUG2_FUSAU|nr:hypothetical protein FAUST_12107 [Fusarium austroamericanum]